MRIQKFYKLWFEIQPFQYIAKQELKQWHLTVCQFEDLGNYQNRKEIGLVDPGHRWGKTGDTGIFTKMVQVTEAFQGYPLYLEIVTGGEAMLSIQGEPFQGNDPNHKRVLLTPQSTGSESYHLEVESFVRRSHNEVGETRFDAACTGEFTQADLCAVDPTAQEFLWDIQFALELWQSHPEYAGPIRTMLTHIFSSFDPVDQASFLAYAAQGRKYLSERFEELGNQNDEFTVWMIGQSHLDLAWFWRKNEAYRKVLRTFTSVLRNMERFDFYRFMMPQVNLFKMLKKASPDVFAQVKEKILDGRIEIAGLLFVEPDTNLVNGEWLIRQILYGRSFFQEEFGKTPIVESLIDAFGYSGNLPQILHKSGIEAVMVTKMRWYNDTNAFPYTAFRWKGIDGTELLSATMPGFNYQCNSQSVKYAMEQNLQPEIVKDIPVFYGWGDGGGGADENHMQGLQRLMAWYKPAKVQTSGFQEYFQRLKEQQTTLPIWWGEIYQEGHRGCYTSQALSKKLNRQSESLYRSLEMIAGFANLLGEGIDLSQLKDNIELILVNQFHDILPGSAVHQVYLDSYKEYEKVLREGQQWLAAWLELVHQSIDTQGEGVPIIVWNFNQVNIPNQVSVFWEGNQTGRLVNAQGQTIPYMFEGDRLVFTADRLPSLGYEVYRFVESKGTSENLLAQPDEFVLENARYQVRLNELGQITQIFDQVHQRDLLVAGTVGNCLKLYFDYPKSNDAWDIDFDYQDAYEIVEGIPVHPVQADPLKHSIKFRYEFGNSEIEQEIILWKHSNRLDFETSVEWHEKHRLLKAEFTLDINTPHAVYDIPFGIIERDTRPNHSFQKAQFEVPALSLVDLSEGNYGVSLVSAHKNGFSAKDQVVSISLLRAPTFPDPQADQGSHEFHYCLIGHEGDYRTGRMIHESRNLIHQPIAVQAANHPGNLPDRFSFLSVDKENVIIEALKPAEDGNGIILRCYETYGQQDLCTLHMGFGFASIIECNLVEEAFSEPLEMQGNQFQFRIHPFEIKTFRLIPK